VWADDVQLHKSLFAEEKVLYVVRKVDYLVRGTSRTSNGHEGCSGKLKTRIIRDGYF
jgi:hypothetical protein